MLTKEQIEERRHQCEVNFVLAKGSTQAMAIFMNLVEQRRGKAAADRLRKSVRERLLEQRKEKGGNYAK